MRLQDGVAQISSSAGRTPPGGIRSRVSKHAAPGFAASARYSQTPRHESGNSRLVHGGLRAPFGGSAILESEEDSVELSQTSET